MRGNVCCVAIGLLLFALAAGTAGASEPPAVLSPSGFLCALAEPGTIGGQDHQETWLASGGGGVGSQELCGAKCGDRSCICFGSDACCDALCEYGCSLCRSFGIIPCEITGTGPGK